MSDTPTADGHTWEVVPAWSWRGLLSLEPAKLVARRREGHRWVYREATKEEVAEYVSADAW
jgi:hypothetical protein